MFITFEGSDGAGKTTQLNLLAEYLRRKGHCVCCTREPGGTPLGDKIRALLLDPANTGMDARAEALLYMAARAQHVAQVILPALERGEVVLCDRYSDSTIVYQGVARRLSRQDLIAVNQFASGEVKPHLTILLECPDGLLNGRVYSRGAKDRMELEAEDFHQAVRRGFRELAVAEPDRIKPVAADGDIQEVHQVIVHLVDNFFEQEGKA